MTDLRREPENATHLSPEERDGLRPSHIVTHEELNEIEQQNILEAVTWVFSRRHDPVDEVFGRKLHKRMFGKVWRWAGSYRKTEKNLGVEPWEIYPRLYEAFEGTRYAILHRTYSPDEIAIRFHYGLVRVHPFPNGNGRWSRLMADILLVYSGTKRFTWGGSGLRADDETRRVYIAALKAADNYDFTPLMEFART